MKIFSVNLDWLEEWTEQADEYVRKGIKLQKVDVRASTLSEAIEKAKSCLSPEDLDDLNRYRAGVL